MITERTLRNWRKDALIANKWIHQLAKEGTQTEVLQMETINNRILRLTEELLDIHLVQKG